jgi:MFS family permease
MGFALLAAQGALAAAVRVLAAPLWGRMIDRFGARPVLECCSFAIALLPLLWLLASPERLWPVWIDPFLAGVFWCGQAQAIFQLPLTLAPSGERPFYLAAFAMTAGLAFAAATGVAGVFATRWTAGCVVFGHRLVGYQLLFAASGIARGAAALLVRRIAEPGARPTRALIQELSMGSRRLGAEWAPAPDAEP